MISVVDNGDTGTKPMLGDILAILGAISCGIYSILIVKLIPNEKAVPMPMFFGFVGLFNLLLFWPVLVVFHYLNIEPFELPSLTIIGMLALNGVFGTVLSDLLWGFAVLLTSPLITTLGISLTIPLALVVDIFLNDKHFVGAYFVGSVLVVLGFFVVNVSTREREVRFWKYMKKKLGLND
eukprot:TRINITY_DN1941_c0_g1_i1.p2 TRINITY_DN1941_c0_g1~~TRINITY_DN1941_c0_g1_i1.p2  ORF type:complete len:180 (-),score=23.37 TRINITY_DN1941_c0_g1_i1:60-599(-)